MMIVRMISGTSLSAFSASIASTRAGQGAPSIQGVRALSGTSAAQAGTASQAGSALPQSIPPMPEGGRPVPRGSLLDLSV